MVKSCFEKIVYFFLVKKKEWTDIILKLQETVLNYFFLLKIKKLNFVE